MASPLPTVSLGTLGDSWVQWSPPPTVPRRAIPFSHIVLNKSMSGSSNNVSKGSLTTTRQVVYYKPVSSKYPALLAQVEAAASASNRLVAPLTACDSRPVVDDSGEIQGIVSFEIPGFKNFHQLENVTEENCILWHISGVLVRRIHRRDDDTWFGNFGAICHPVLGEVAVDLDYDMEWYDIAYPLKGGPRLIPALKNYPPPELLFPYTLRDLRNFPILEDAQPCHSTTKSPNNNNLFKKFNYIELFKKLAYNKDFIRQKWYYFLLEAVVPLNLHGTVLEDNFEQKEAAKKWFNDMDSSHNLRVKDLSSKLPLIDCFRNHLLAHPDWLNKYLDLFESVSPPENSQAVKDVELAYYNIVQKSLSCELTQILLQHIKKASSKEQSAVLDVLVDSVAKFDGAHQFKTGFLSLQIETAQISMNPLVLKLIPQDYLTTLQKWSVFTGSGGVAQSTMLQSMATVKPPTPKEPPVAHKVLANAIYHFLVNAQSNQHAVEVANQAKMAYAPSRFNTTRKRSRDFDAFIEVLEKERGVVVFKAFAQFIEKGQWHTGGVLSYPSANPLLMKGLIDAALSEFQSNLTADKLKVHDLVPVLQMIETNKIKVDSLYTQIASEVYLLVKELAKDLAKNPPLN